MQSVETTKSMATAVLSARQAGGTTGSGAWFRRAAAFVLVLMIGAAGVGVRIAHALEIIGNPSALASLYKGSDGGLLYLRSVGPKVVGFAEHPTQGYAFVLVGTRDGNQISASWWDVPKGTRVTMGQINLTIVPTGTGVAGLTRTGGSDFGPDWFTGIGVESITSWPGPKPAGFQSISATDLDGAFDGNDGSRHYVRNTGDDVIWVGEAKASPGARPSWATVFVGKRNADATISGSFYDVPKGTTSATSGFGAASISGERRTSLSQIGVLRTAQLEPDYVVDFDAFADAIESEMAGTVVGFGYAITYKGQVVRSGSGGLRKIARPGVPGDSTLPFQNTTQNGIDSASKMITAVALVRALDEHGLDVDDTIGAYLPDCWNVPAEVAVLSFRQLLDHSAGLYYAGKTVCADDPYRCLREAVEKGRTRPPGYHNIHYALIRLLLPFVVEKSAMKAAFADHDCAADGADLNAIFSSVFRTDLLDLFAKADVVGDLTYTSPNRALSYNFADTTIPGDLQDSDSVLRGGPGGVVTSAPELARFLAAFDGGKLVRPALVKMMKNDRLGFDDITNKSFRGSSGLGPYYKKNGGHTDGLGRGAGTWIMMLPSRIQVALTYNSGSNPADAPPRDSMLKAAFEGALQ